MSQSGFAPVLVVVGVLILFATAGGGIFYLNNSQLPVTGPATDISSPKPAGELPADLPLDPVSEATSSAVIPPVISASSGKKLLTASACHISLLYPENWQVETYEEKTACLVSVGQNKPKPVQFHITGNGTPQINLDSIKKPEAADLVVDNVSGFIQPAGTIDGITAEVFYLIKDRVIFIGQITYQTGDTEGAAVAKEVISSLRFTGDESAYTGATVVNFNNHITESVYDKTNTRLLKTIIEQYKTDTGSLPEKLTDLNSGVYLEMWNSKRKGTDKITDLYYSKSGNQFTVKSVLPNGVEFILEGGQ